MNCHFNFLKESFLLNHVLLTELINDDYPNGLCCGVVGLVDGVLHELVNRVVEPFLRACFHHVLVGPYGLVEHPYGLHPFHVIVEHGVHLLNGLVDDGHFVRVARAWVVVRVVRAWVFTRACYCDRGG